MQGAVGEAETNRIQVISRYIDKVGAKIYNKLFRGGVSVIFGGPTATGVLTGHNAGMIPERRTPMVSIS
jgi:hypothetical protein